MDNPDVRLTTKDYVAKVAKGALGAIPIIGGLLGELIDMAIVPKQQDKLHEWFEFVDNTLKEIINKGTSSKEDIFNNEEFLSVFQKTSRIYLNNVEQHKRPILQAYLRESVTSTVPLDKKYIFLNMIDTLTETQLLILRDIYDNEKSDNYLYETQLNAIFVDKYANGDMNYLQLLLKGLKDFHLLNFLSADVVIDKRNQMHMRPSKIAIDLFEYLQND